MEGDTTSMEESTTTEERRAAVGTLTADLGRALASAELEEWVGERLRLARFLLTLREETQRLNLTAIRDPEEALQRHVVEPLAGWRRLEATARSGEGRGPVVDVGAGGGAPGAPIGIVAPERAVTLLESRERRAAYLRRLANVVEGPGLSVVEQRAEDFGRSAGPQGGPGAGREAFALALTRALAALPVALELLLPLVRVGGEAVVYGGPGARERLAEAALVAAACGGEPPVLEPVSWPGARLELVLVRVRKARPTPTGLPRRMRQMRKGPPRTS